MLMRCSLVWGEPMKPHSMMWASDDETYLPLLRWMERRLIRGALIMWLGALVLVGCSTNTERSMPREGTGSSIAPGDTMHIQFERAGGFAGMRLTVDLQTDTLPQEDQLRLRQLVDEADFFALPAELRDTGTAPDEFTYKLTIETSDRRHTVETTESAAGPKLRPLLEWLTRAARRRT